MKALDYQEALRNAAVIMVRVKNPVTMIKLITRFLDRELGVTHTSIIVFDVQKGHYIFCDSKGTKKIPVSLIKLDRANPLIRWFMARREKVGPVSKDFVSAKQLRELLAGGPAEGIDENARGRLERLQETMQTFSAELCVPGYYKGELLGIFMLGDKKDESAFSREEILLFQTLASDISMTIKNAEYQRSLLHKISELENNVEKVKEFRERDREKYLQTILTLAQMVDARDPYTYGHSEDVKRLGMMTAEELRLDLSDDKERILSSALLLHDVGKLGVPDEILHKKGSLNEDEWLKMKDHARIGARILENHDDFKEVSVIIVHHHENYDGSGYPYGLKGEEIPIQSRIIAVVDAFHAMISNRPYRKGMPYDVALEELKKCSGKQFDPEVVEAFLRVIDRQISVPPDTSGR